MFKFSFKKKNKIPEIRNLHAKKISPEFAWLIIMSASLAVVVLSVCVSIFLSWKVLNESSFKPDKGKKDQNLLLVNQERLQNAIKAIDSRRAQEVATSSDVGM